MSDSRVLCHVLPPREAFISTNCRHSCRWYSFGSINLEWDATSPELLQWLPIAKIIVSTKSGSRRPWCKLSTRPIATLPRICRVLKYHSEVASRRVVEPSSAINAASWESKHGPISNQALVRDRNMGSYAAVYKQVWFPEAGAIEVVNDTLETIKHRGLCQHLMYWVPTLYFRGVVWCSFVAISTVKTI